MRREIAAIVVSTIALIGFGDAQAIAGAHTWDVFELFSNADGSIQFIELKETNGGTGEFGVGGKTVTSNTSSFTITSNVATPTSFRHLLFATASFAALPGAPTPDYIIPANFFSVTADTIRYNPYDSWSFTAGQLPTDGINSRQRDCLTCANSPTNYAGQTGSVNANPPTPAPPAVPDGGTGTPMTVVANDAAGTSLSISWDTTTCSNAAAYNIIYGQKSNLPTAPGGTFSVAGSVCGIGPTSPFTWTSAPADSDGLGLIWWIVVATDGQGVEGPWGKGSNLLERMGPGAAGSSEQCGVTTKKVTNTCGH
jgi:hypothetical protein